MIFNQKKILVTGATGCLGYHIVEKLLELDCNEVRCIARSSESLEFQENDKVKIFIGRLSDTELISRTLQDIDIVIHCAAKVHSYAKTQADNEEFYSTNVKDTIHLFEECNRCKVERVIFVSTVAVYENLQVIDEKTLKSPQTTYGKSKLLAEEHALKLWKDQGFPVTVLQLATLFGERDRGNFKNLCKLIKGKFVPIVGNGGNIKTFTYVKDAVNAVVKSLENQNTIGEELIIADVYEESFSELIRYVSKQLQVNVHLIKIPYLLLKIAAYFLDKVTGKGFAYKINAAIRETRYDTSKSKDLLGEYIEYGFKDGLNDCIKWYKREIKIK